MNLRHLEDLLTGRMDIVQANSQYRIVGWRGWLDQREAILRMIEGEIAPRPALIVWRLEYLWKVSRFELICALLGHRWQGRDRRGTYCLRCARGPEDL